MSDRKDFAYWSASGIGGQYTRNANAYQKIRLAVENLHADLLIPAGRKSALPCEFQNYEKIVEMSMPWWLKMLFPWKTGPIGMFIALAKWCRTNQKTLILPVSNEFTLVGAIFATFLSPIWILCWDPPGVSVRNRNNILSKFRCWIMDCLLCRATQLSRGLILNLHGEFVKDFNQADRAKVHVFPNGTDYEFNRRCARGIAHIHGRVAVNSTFSRDKGCWNIADLFVQLWHQDNKRSLIWVGAGPEIESVREYFIKRGLPDSSFVLGKLPHEIALRQLSSCSIALCMYNDIPSLRWNYILKAPEFLSLGIPVVASNLPGVAQYIQNGNNGYLIDPSNTNMILDKLNALLRDEKMLRIMSEFSIHSVQQYDWRIINKEIANKIVEAS